MARATESYSPRDSLNGQIGMSQQQVARSRHTPFQDIPVGWHAQTLAKRTLEVAHANACKTGEFVQRD